MKVSIIVPCHNAIGKVERCIASLRAQDFAHPHEVIFIDDCSDDGTHAFLEAEVARHPDWRVLQTERNSGSPSHPRNLGVQVARGDYVFFLDCDDRIFEDTLTVHHAHAVASDCCVVRGFLIVDDGKSLVEMNRVTDFSQASSNKQRIELIIRKQSTTVPSLIKRDLLVRHGIVWNEGLRMGEDTVFLIDVLTACERIGYIDHPTFVYNKAVSRVTSSTRTYGARELCNHLEVWSTAERMLERQGISYVTIRFQVGLQTVLQALIHYSRGDIDEALFKRFSDFVSERWRAVSAYRLNARLASLLDLLRANDYTGFFEEAKPRLLIAGYDLKFIEKLVPVLSRRFQVRVDEWVGHNAHDTAASNEALDWAEFIFCEWFLGNAVWYARNKRKDQRLVVRTHRFELSRKFGHVVADDNVDIYIAVSVLYFERLVETFNIDRAKVRLLPNHVDFDGYASLDAPSRVFNLALVGSLPSRKGLLKALELLRSLVALDPRYNLVVYGKSAWETAWVTRDPVELAYFQRCDEYIQANGLYDHVKFKGHVDVTRALADIGFVLSTSDDGHLPESFHIAPADGFAAGGQGLLLDWSGVEYIYPAEFVFPSLDAMRDHILHNADYELFREGARKGREFVAHEYSVSQFLDRLDRIFRDLL
ncbi:glycosyltransferase [Lysobacter cavernae]|uniref:Glycosyltransferase n=1 Tax=Lysobacter cavernae TaxID=1685901 RepID=A0ABV7RRW7_9GAMM